MSRFRLSVAVVLTIFQISLPFLAGADFPTNAEQKRLEHGKREAERFLTDRTLAKFFRDSTGEVQEITIEDGIAAWAATRFAQLGKREIIVWAPYPLPPGRSGAFYHRNSTSPGMVLIASDRIVEDGSVARATFCELWRELALCLWRAEFAEAFDALYQRFQSKTISDEEYATEVAQLDFRAEENVVKFYIEVFKPWAKQRGYVPQEKVWQQRDVSSFESWLKTFSEEPPENPRRKVLDHFRRRQKER